MPPSRGEEPGEAISAETLVQIASELNLVFRQSPVSLSFVVSQQDPLLITKLVDTRTGEIITQFYPDELLKIAGMIKLNLEDTAKR